MFNLTLYYGELKTVSTKIYDGHRYDVEHAFINKKVLVINNNNTEETFIADMSKVICCEIKPEQE